jgi:hypothetical protein
MIVVGNDEWLYGARATGLVNHFWVGRSSGLGFATGIQKKTGRTGSHLPVRLFLQQGTTGSGSI